MDDLGRGEVWAQLAASSPIGRNGTDDEIGGLIGFLCSSAASWIHGEALNVNGGEVMSP
jgi:3-oxoacyl-[acyl-carrier protein] reductase